MPLTKKTVTLTVIVNKPLWLIYTAQHQFLPKQSELGLKIHHREYCLDVSDQVPSALSEPEGFSLRARRA